MTALALNPAPPIALAALAEAQSWLGTPYVHRASCKGAGADCLGLIRGLWRHLYGAEPQVLPPYDPLWIGAKAGDEPLKCALEQFFHPKPLDQPQLGDLLLFRMKEAGPAKHLGLQSGLQQIGKQIGGQTPKFIHAYSGHGVCESAFSAPWQRRLLARYDFPHKRM